MLWEGKFEQISWNRSDEEQLTTLETQWDFTTWQVPCLLQFPPALHRLLPAVQLLNLLP